jgi:UDP-N-acetylglucosamine--N-acetylmuramyl-(pentapeptide) pyrophosphoryl-undecaprenol N-acetylglucosamine transferase
VSDLPIRLMIAASGTGGHLFPALALAEELPSYYIEWLGVPDRLEQAIVPKQYLLNTINVGGFQQPFGVNTLRILMMLLISIWKVRKLLKEHQIDVVFTTGGYIAAPTILAARSLKIPVILHESNFLPGKVTRWFGSMCHTVALGFSKSAQYLPRARTSYVSTPVRSQFLSPQKLELPIPEDKLLIVVAGGSQGAVALNKIVRQGASTWLDMGAAIVHLTGNNDPENDSLQHPNYITMPFYDNMAGLFQRANLAISRAGAGTLTELAVSRTPSVLIPYPYAAEDHQSYNARVFANGGAALMFSQSELNANLLQEKVSHLLRSPQQLEAMAEKASRLALPDSAKRLADLIGKGLEARG